MANENEIALIQPIKNKRFIRAFVLDIFLRNRLLNLKHLQSGDPLSFKYFREHVIHLSGFYFLLWYPQIDRKMSN